MVHITLYDYVKMGLGFSGIPPGTLMIEAIQPNSWGRAAGLLSHDILVEVQGLQTSFLTKEQIAHRFAEVRPLNLVFVRDPDRITIGLK